VDIKELNWKAAVFFKVDLASRLVQQMITQPEQNIFSKENLFQIKLLEWKTGQFQIMEEPC
jgi:hypothetical protein